jgi:hypothetical protein
MFSWTSSSSQPCFSQTYVLFVEQVADELCLAELNLSRVERVLWNWNHETGSPTRDIDQLHEVCDGLRGSVVDQDVVRVGLHCVAPLDELGHAVSDQTVALRLGICPQ